MLPRRTFVLGGAAVLAQRYKLGCMAAMYSAVPLIDALARIRRIGYRYICPSPAHAGEPVFSPEVRERSAALRRMRDAGLEPFLSLGGFRGEPGKPEGLKRYLAELDLCRDFGIGIMVGGGPWYYQKFPNLPKRAAAWDQEVSEFYAGMEKAVRHAESLGVTIALKPHTGITATARSCIEVVRRVGSERLKIAWDAGNVSFYEGIYPDPDLPELAPHVRAVCVKDHLGPRAEAYFPVPGQGQIDHPLMFRTLFEAGFNGPIAVERVDGRDGKAKLTPEVIDERLAQAYRYLVSVLDSRS